MIEVLSFWNASVIEITWTVLGVAGLYYTLHNLRDASSYVTALEEMNGKNIQAHNRLKIIAFGHYRDELLRTGMTSIIIGIGLAACITPAPVPTPPLTPVSLVLTFGLFLMELLIIIAGALSKKQRQLLSKP